MAVILGLLILFRPRVLPEFFTLEVATDELERFNSSYRPNEVILIYNCDDKMIDNIINYAIVLFFINGSFRGMTI